MSSQELGQATAGSRTILCQVVVHTFSTPPRMPGGEMEVACFEILAGTDRTVAYGRLF